MLILELLSKYRKVDISFTIKAIRQFTVWLTDHPGIDKSYQEATMLYSINMLMGLMPSNRNEKPKHCVKE